MKQKIHPDYTPEAKITCVCGNNFTVGSTLPEINIETCSQCHPFYTGKQKLSDTGRVKRFEGILEASQALSKLQKKKVKKTKKTAKK